MLESYKSVVGPAKPVRGGIFASGEATQRRDSGVPATDGGSVTGDSLVSEQRHLKFSRLVFQGFAPRMVCVCSNCIRAYGPEFAQFTGQNGCAHVRPGRTVSVDGPDVRLSRDDASFSFGHGRFLQGICSGYSVVKWMATVWRRFVLCGHLAQFRRSISGVSCNQQSNRGLVQFTASPQWRRCKHAAVACYRQTA